MWMARMRTRAQGWLVSKSVGWMTNEQRDRKRVFLFIFSYFSDTEQQKLGRSCSRGMCKWRENEKIKVQEHEQEHKKSLGKARWTGLLDRSNFSFWMTKWPGKNMIKIKWTWLNMQECVNLGKGGNNLHKNFSYHVTFYKISHSLRINLLPDKFQLKSRVIRCWLNGGSSIFWLILRWN